MVTTERGPFAVGGITFSATLAELQLGDESSVLHVRLLDDAGVLHYEEAFDEPGVSQWGLEHTVAIDLDPVHGQTGEALLVTRTRMPTAPLTGVSLQLLAVRDGRVVPLHAPLSYYGEHQLPEPTTPGGARQLDAGDVLNLELWRYHFGVLLPLRLDLACSPEAETCVQPAAPAVPGAQGFVAMDVSAEPRAPQHGVFITLHPRPGEDEGQRVPVHADSEVQVLEAAARVGMRAGELLEPVLHEEHLRVRIDGREGWIRGPEAFEAIGLPGAG